MTIRLRGNRLQTTEPMLAVPAALGWRDLHSPGTPESRAGAQWTRLEGGTQGDPSARRNRFEAMLGDGDLS